MPNPPLRPPPFPAKPSAALLLVGHGSTENPDSSEPTHRHADRIRSMGLFAEVACAFWKEEPSMPEVWHALDSTEVYVVPHFISEGYFTTEVIPRELGLTGRTTPLDRCIAQYCDPVGIHPSMTGLLLSRAAAVAPDLDPAQTALLIVGHGTHLNSRSRDAIVHQVSQIRRDGPGFAEVIDCYMEEEPLVSAWDQFTTAQNVIVVPFFIADGLHSYQDIPVMLGIEEAPGPAASQRAVFQREPRSLRGRRLFYSNAIGTEDSMTDVILDQVAHFDAHYRTAAP